MIKVKLGDVATYINGYAFKPSDWSNEGTPIIRIQDLTGNSYQVNKFQGQYLKKYEVQKGDVLISWSASLGVYIWQGDTAVLNQHIFKVVFDKVEIDKRFFVYQVESILEKSSNAAHGATMKHLTKPIFDALPFYLPGKNEQKVIADKLDKVTALIAKRKEQLVKLDQLVKSRFIELFGNIDECENKLELQDICLKITDGSHNPPSGVEKSQNYMISSQNIHDNIIDYKDVRYLSDSDFENENRRTAIMLGDVLLTIVGAIGRSAVVKDDLNITCQRSVCVIHPNRDKVNSIFLKYMLDSISDKIINEARGAAQKGIYLNQVKKLQIICPSLNFQSQFAAFVEQTDKSKLAIQQSLEQLETLKKSLMQKYFG